MSTRTVFAVERYIDQIREKDHAKLLAHDDKMNRYGHAPTQFFDTQREAAEFVIRRAETAVADAAKKLLNAKRRRDKCVKKWQGL